MSFLDAINEAAALVKPQATDEGVVLHAYNPIGKVTAEMAARNMFPAYNLTIALLSLARSHKYDLNVFSETTASTLAKISDDLAAFIDGLPTVTVKFDRCNKRQQETVRKFAAGEFVKTQDPAERHILAAALAKSVLSD